MFFFAAVTEGDPANKLLNSYRLTHLSMKLPDEISELMVQKSKLNPNDPSHTVFYERILQRLIENETETTQFIEQLSSQELLLELSPFFDELTARFLSKRLLVAIENLPDRFAQLEENDRNYVENKIQAAKKAMGTQEQQQAYLEQVAFDKRMAQITSKSEQELIELVRDLEDQDVLIALYGQLYSITKRLRSRRFIDLMEQSLSKVHDLRAKHWIVLCIQDAREELTD